MLDGPVQWSQERYEEEKCGEELTTTKIFHPWRTPGVAAHGPLSRITSSRSCVWTFGPARLGDGGTSLWSPPDWSTSDLLSLAAFGARACGDPPVLMALWVIQSMAA